MKKRRHENQYSQSDFRPLYLLLAIMSLGAILWLYGEVKIVKAIEPISPMGTMVVKAQEPAPQLIVEAPKPTPKAKFYSSAFDNFIYQYALKYKVSPELTSCIIFHESSFRPWATNSGSTATGLGQFLQGTWKWMRGLMGESQDLSLRTDPEESIKTLSWAVSKGYKNHWLVVTSGLCKGVK